MIFTENGNIGHPALALIATRSRSTSNGFKRHKVRAGEIRSIQLIASQESIKASRRYLIQSLGQGATFSSKNWRIAVGTAVSTPAEVASFESAQSAQEARVIALIGQPEYTVTHVRIGAGYDSGRAICDAINREVGEHEGSVGESARAAMQAQIDALDDDVVELYEISVVETGIFQG